MSTEISTTAMVLAAGLGTRMRPLTLTKPKPLFEVGGKTMLDHAIDKLKEFGVRRVVVNTFYLAEQVEEYLGKRQDLEIIISREEELLDTGGGLKNARKSLGDKPFFVLNADMPWMDGDRPSLQKMAEVWDPETMDQLMLVMRTEKARGFNGKGDFVMESGGRLWRKDASFPRPYVWLSAQIMKLELLDQVEEKVFSNNKIFDICEARGKLFGVEHEGTCYHTGTPEDLGEANRLLASGQGWGIDI